MEILDIEAAVSSSAHLVLRIVKFDTVGPTISYFNVCIALLFMRRTRCADDDTAALNITLLTRNSGSPSEITSIVFLPIVSKASIPSETNSSPLLVTALDNDVKPQEEKTLQLSHPCHYYCCSLQHLCQSQQVLAPL